jgi:hypothetical protein
MRTALIVCSLTLTLAAPAFAQNRLPVAPAALPGKNDLDPANDPAIRKEIENIHGELANMLKQQTDLLKTITPNAGIIPLNGEGKQPCDRMYGSGRTGLGLVPLTNGLRNGLKIDPDVGLLVRNVFPDTPAAQAGYLPGDILIEFNGNKAPADIGAFMGAAAFLKSDVPIPSVVLRGDKRVELKPMVVTDRRVVPCSVETVGARSAANVMNAPAMRNPFTTPYPIQRFDGVKDVTFVTK